MLFVGLRRDAGRARVAVAVGTHRSTGGALPAVRSAGPAAATGFVAALSGIAKISPTAAQAEAPLQRMVEAIKSGRIGGFIPFDPSGEPVQFN